MIAAHLTYPGERDLAHQVSPTDDADKFLTAQHGHPFDLAINQQEAHFVDAGALHDADHVTGHRLAGCARVWFGNQVVFANQTDHVPFAVAYG